jgi:hypothetical protein
VRAAAELLENLIAADVRGQRHGRILASRPRERPRAERDQDVSHIAVGLAATTPSGEDCAADRMLTS